MDPNNDTDQHIIADKTLRRDIDAIIDRLKIESGQRPHSCGKRVNTVQSTLGQRSVCECGVTVFLRSSRERATAITKLQEAMMWLGMDLKEINDGVSCYPNGKDPSNTIVDPVEGGLKF